MPAYTLVAHLRVKDDPAAIEKVKAKLQEASQIYSNDKETIDWYVMQGASDPRDFTIVERYEHESSQKYHLENPYWQISLLPGHIRLVYTFDKYVVPLLEKPIDLRRYNELDLSKKVRVEEDEKLWEAVKQHQEQK